ncbi:BON domain-containing protein [Arthrobacter antioxidans]|uniref:BON domain-containing protein n=1 Tax=Arthrobacter antioxidans TaxID=2895818 RepID=UPI0020001FB9|nr:BON domain-containing protein [Arthrobacter antioxidans]
MTMSLDNHALGGGRRRAADDHASLEDLLRQAVRRAADCASLDITVTEGIVMLSGVVLRREDRSRAGFACWCDPTVRAVYNNLTVASSPA